MKKIIKNFLVVIACLIAGGVGCLWGLVTHTYADAAVVYEVNSEKDIVLVEDFNGNLWKFKGAEDWEKNDICALKMWDAMTPHDVEDDVILDVYYSGWIK